MAAGPPFARTSTASFCGWAMKKRENGTDLFPAENGADNDYGTGRLQVNPYRGLSPVF